MRLCQPQKGRGEMMQIGDIVTVTMVGELVAMEKMYNDKVQFTVRQQLADGTVAATALVYDETMLVKAEDPDAEN
jgi:hypothetical protein